MFGDFYNQNPHFFLLAQCRLPDLLRMACVNKGWNSRIQSRLSGALGEKYGVSNYELVKEIYLALPLLLKRKVNQDVLSLLEAEQLALPKYFRHQIEMGDTTLLNVRAQIKRAKTAGNLFDRIGDGLGPDFFNEEISDLSDDFSMMYQTILDSEWFSLHTELTPAIAKLIHPLFKETGPYNVASCDSSLARLAHGQLEASLIEKIPEEDQGFLLFLSGQYAFISGTVVVKDNSNEMAIAIANNCLPQNKVLTTNCLSQVSWAYLLTTHTLFALEHGLIDPDDLKNVRGSQRKKLPLVLSELGLDALTKAGNYKNLMRQAPYLKDLFALMYDQDMATLRRDNPLYKHITYYQHLTSRRTKYCISAGYFTADELFSHFNDFHSLYLITSESGIACFKNGTMTFLQAINLDPPSRLAEFIIEHRDIPCEMQWLPLVPALKNEVTTKLEEMIRAAKNSLCRSYLIFPAPYRTLLGCLDEFENDEKTVSEMFAMLIKHANVVEPALALQFREYEKELKLRNQELTIAARAGVCLMPVVGIK